MNQAQQLYYDQVVSDLEVFDHLEGKRACHRLHYLQMLSEKLAKAYFYGKALPVSKTHTGLRRFVRALAAEQKIWKDLRFSRRDDFEGFLDGVNHLAIDIERLAPAECQNGPNPEYPWPPPPHPPAHSPVAYDFPLWEKLIGTAHGRKFLHFLRAVIKLFPQRF